MRGTWTRPRAKARPGFAAITALWVVATIGLLCATMLGRQRSAAIEAHRLWQQATHAAEMQATTNLTILALLDRRADHRPRVDGVAATIALGGHSVSISVQHQGGLVDLNHADQRQLIRLLTICGADASTAEAIAQSIIVWRETHPGGFTRTDELRLLPAVNDTVYNAVADLVTVAGGHGAVDPQTAPRPALLASGISPQAADALIQRRAATGTFAAAVLPISAGLINQVIAPDGWAFTIDVTGPVGDGPEVRTRTLLRLVNDAAQPALILAQDDLQ